jgi:hypothetical protein
MSVVGEEGVRSLPNTEELVDEATAACQGQDKAKK